MTFALGWVGCSRVAIVGYDAPAAESADGGDADAGQDAGGPIAIRGPRSQLPWPSGVHYGNEAAAYESYAEYRARPVDLAALYTDRNSWAGLVTPSWQLDAFADFPGQLVLSEPFYPPGMGNNQQCAAGAYDGEWRKLGTLLAERGRSDTIIRLGWGLNDPEHAWHADADPADFIACYRRIVRAVRATNPRVQFDFTFDALPSAFPASGNPFDAYPGDDFVDIVGIDLFDRLPETDDEAEWKAKCESPIGLCTLIAFARAHQKRFSVGEWGVSTCGEDPGGDSPFFVQKMFETFLANADILAYEAYFDDGGANVCSTLMDPDNAPEARRTYRALYRDL